MIYQFAPHLTRSAHVDLETHDGVVWERTIEVWRAPLDPVPIAMCLHPWTRREQAA